MRDDDPCKSWRRVTRFVNARDKILAFHMVEKRVEQILDWIEHGKEPVFC